MLMITYILFLETPRGKTIRTAGSYEQSDSTHSLLQPKHERADAESLFASPSHGTEEDSSHSSDVDVTKLVEKIDSLERELQELKASIGVSYIRQGKGPQNQINPEVRKIDVKKLPKHEQVCAAITLLC